LFQKDISALLDRNYYFPFLLSFHSFTYSIEPHSSFARLKRFSIVQPDRRIRAALFVLLSDSRQLFGQLRDYHAWALGETPSSVSNLLSIILVSEIFNKQGLVTT
jgi:hypothetical protein